MSRAVHATHRRFRSLLSSLIMPRVLSRHLAALPCAIVLCCAVGCRGSDRPTPAGAGDVGGTMIIVQPAEPRTLFPPTMSETSGLVVIDAIFDRLAEIGPELETNGDGGFQPRLAQSWTWAKDSLSIAFALNPKARWHDGAPVRAEDVRYTFAVYTADIVGAANKAAVGNIDSVSVRDSLTAVFWFKRRLPSQFFEATYNMYILPSHLLASLPMAALETAPFGHNPIGTGRFRFAKWDPNARLEIIADTANARGRAKLDRVVWTFAQDAGAATVKLFAGEADFYEAVRPENQQQLKAAPQLRLEENRPLQYGYLQYNLHTRGKTMRQGPPHPVLGDLTVRRALAMAVDRARDARNVFDVFGMVALAPAPRAFIPDTSALTQIPYNPPAARALLDSAGWRVNPRDSIRERNGVRLSFEMMTASSSQSGQTYTVLLQAQFKAIGVDAKPLTLDGRGMGQRVESGNWDSFMNTWSMSPGRLGMPLTWSTRGSLNFGGYASAAFDSTLDRALSTFDAATARGRWTRVFQQLIDDQPGLFLYEQRTPVAIHVRIRNTPLRPDAWSAGLADWTIDPKQRIARDRIGLGSAR